MARLYTGRKAQELIAYLSLGLDHTTQSLCGLTTQQGHIVLVKSDCTPGCAEKASTPVPFSFSFSALAIMMLYSLLAPYTCMSLLVLFSPLQSTA